MTVRALSLLPLLAALAACGPWQTPRAEAAQSAPAKSTAMAAACPMAGNMAAGAGSMHAACLQHVGAMDDAARSLRQDLARMPAMSAAELKAFLPAHQARLARLLDLHAACSAGMRAPAPAQTPATTPGGAR